VDCIGQCFALLAMAKENGSEYLPVNGLMIVVVVRNFFGVPFVQTQKVAIPNQMGIVELN
jgi:hypothetical protein